MTFTGLLNQALVIHRRSSTTTDIYGNEVPATTSTTTVYGYLEQTEATEVTVDRETYITTWLVVLPSDTVIDGNDHVAYGSLVVKVIGQPHRVWNPRTQSTHQVKFRGQEVTG